jgi:hypothetical protein
MSSPEDSGRGREGRMRIVSRGKSRRFENEGEGIDERGEI